jgi:hypothetical protein
VCAAIELADALGRRYPSQVARLACSWEQTEMTMSYIDDLAHDVPLIGRMTQDERLRLAECTACVQNNSFERVGGAGITYLLVGFSMAKVNHSCDPNAIFAPSTRVNELHLIARRGIRLGEEITLSYIQGEQTMAVQERRQRLFNGWCFWCACELCVAEASHSARRASV